MTSKTYNRLKLSDSPVALEIEALRAGLRQTSRNVVLTIACSPELYKRARRIAIYRGHRNLSAVIRESLDRLFDELKNDPDFPPDPRK